MALHINIKYIMLVAKDKFIFRNSKNKEEVLKIKEPIEIPHVPFYHYLFDSDSLEGDFKIKNNERIKNSLFCLLEDDANHIDKVILEDYCREYLNTSKVSFIEQSVVLNMEHNKYVTVSKTKRSIVVAYIENNSVIKKNLLDIKVEIAEVEEIIKDYMYTNRFESIPLYINNINDDMSEFSFMGILVGKEVIFENIGYSKNHFWRCRINK